MDIVFPGVWAAHVLFLELIMKKDILLPHPCWSLLWGDSSTSGTHLALSIRYVIFEEGAVLPAWQRYQKRR